jgi:hypothetical protein
MRKALALGTAAAASLATVLAATPASAACTDNVLNVCSGTTAVALVVEAGTIAIVATPVATNLTSVISGTSNVQTVNLGLTTVTDTRLTSSGWTVSASSSELAPTTGTAIPSSAASFYVPAAATAVLGGHTITRAADTLAGAVANGAALVTDTGSGVNTATFIPHMKVTIPSGTAALSYTGTVTQSVA